MSSLINLYLKKESVLQLLDACDKGVSITVSVNDKANDYNQNVSAFISQSKDDKDNGVARVYVANGNVTWTDGKITAFKKEANPKETNQKHKSKLQQEKESGSNEDDLPF